MSELGNIKQLFYKTASDFAQQFEINEDLIVELLTDTTMGSDHPRATLLGLTEIELLKKLDLWISVEGYDESQDPRNLIYIVYINI